MNTPILSGISHGSTRIRSFHLQAGGERLAGSVTECLRNPRPRVLAIHGAGKATRARVQYLLSSLAEYGFSSVSFDFSGHGESTGTMRESSLQKRSEETKAIFEHFFGQDLELCIATSMGAHVVAVALPFLQPKAVALFCPGAFAEEAQFLNFDETFTKALRRPGSYRSSPAFTSLRAYFGRLLVVVGGQDEVIPREVLDLYTASSSNCASSEVIEIRDAGHQLHAWLSAHSTDQSLVLDGILRLVGISTQIQDRRL